MSDAKVDFTVTHQANCAAVLALLDVIRSEAERRSATKDASIADLAIMAHVLTRLADAATYITKHAGGKETTVR